MMLGSLSFLRHRTQGLSSFMAHFLCHTAILPAMLWASPAWWIGTAPVLDPLCLTYNRIARWITGLPPSTGITKLLSCAGLPPLTLFMDYLSTNYAIRLCFLPKSHILGRPLPNDRRQPYLPGLPRLHSFIKDMITSTLENRQTTSHGSIPTIIIPHLSKDKFAKHIHERWISTLEDDTVLCYTDGSRLDDGSTGCGLTYYFVGDQVARRQSNHRCSIGNHAEVYDTELYSASEGLRLFPLTYPNHPPGKIILCIDNQAAISALENNQHNHQFARDAINHATSLAALGWKLSTTWTPSHVGIAGNEVADSLAKLAAEFLSPICQNSITTHCWMKAEARRRFFTLWSAAHPDATPSFRFPPHLSMLKWTETRALFRIYCGRSPTDPYPSQPPSKCASCGGPATSEHFIASCSGLSESRASLKNSLTGDISLTNCISSEKNAKATLKFLHSTGLGFAETIRFDIPTGKLVPDDASDPESEDLDII
jgi:ribonuclease HI